MASEETSVPEVEAPTEPVAETTAPKRRRATKKAAAPATAVTHEEAAADEASPQGDPESAPPAKKAAKRAPRKTTRKKAAEAAPETDSTPAAQSTPETSDEEAPTVQADREAAPEADPGAQAAASSAGEPVEGEETDEEEPEEEPGEEPAADGAAVPNFGLLFQAPDTTVVRRSRRATAPAQAPSHDQPEPDAPAAQTTPGEPESTAESTEDDAAGSESSASRRRRRGGRGRRSRTGTDEHEGTDGPSGDGSADAGSESAGEHPPEDPTDGDADSDADESASGTSSRRRRRRRRGSGGGDGDDPPGTVTRVRQPRASTRDEPTAVRGSTRLEAKKQRRREGREAGRRRTIITEAEFLARRESVERVMVVRGQGERTQIGVLEDGVLVEHYVSRETATTMVGNVYLGRVQNVLPSMEAAFVDIGKGRNAVLYAGEVNWDAAGLEVNQAKRIENALTSGDTVLVQVTKDPIGHKGARLTSQISLPGRFLVYVPEGSMTGISRKLPDVERARLKSILKEIVPDSAGVIVRTAAEGASEDELRADVDRLTKAWAKIQQKAETAAGRKAGSGGAPVLVHGEPDLTVRVIRDIFTEDFTQLVVSGDKAWSDISEYVEDVAPDLAPRLSRWTSEQDVFTAHRVQEQIAKAMDRKVWLPSGGSLVIDRTEAMTVVDVNTGKFVGSGGNLEETVTKNNIEAAEEIVRQLRLRDIGGIIVIDFIDMVLESNRDLVVRRLLECLGRDRTKHQVAEVTSLGLVQMTRKRVGSGLIEVFSETCEHCNGRGLIVHSEPIDKVSAPQAAPGAGSGSRGRGRRGSGGPSESAEPERKTNGLTAAQIAAAAHAAARISSASMESAPADQDAPSEVVREIDGDEEQSLAEPEPQAAATEAEGAEPATESEPQTESPPEPEVSGEDEAAPAVSGEDEAEPAAYAEPETQPEAESEPEPAPRRRRGRVIAPAGPPRPHTEP